MLLADIVLHLAARMQMTSGVAKTIVCGRKSWRLAMPLKRASQKQNLTTFLASSAHGRKCCARAVCPRFD